MGFLLSSFQVRPLPCLQNNSETTVAQLVSQSPASYLLPRSAA